MDHVHEKDVETAYASIQAMLNRLTPVIVSNMASVEACTKTIADIPDQVVNAMLPRLTTTIHSIHDNLSMTMVSTMTSALMIFWCKG